MFLKYLQLINVETLHKTVIDNYYEDIRFHGENTNFISQLFFYKMFNLLNNRTFCQILTEILIKTNLILKFYGNCTSKNI